MSIHYIDVYYNVHNKYVNMYIHVYIGTLKKKMVFRYSKNNNFVVRVIKCNYFYMNRGEKIKWYLNAYRLIAVEVVLNQII